MASADLWAADTSVAVATLDAAHSAHGPCLEAVRVRRPTLAGHTAFELYAVITRMPGHLAVDPNDAAALIDHVFPEISWLSPESGEALRDRLAIVGIRGGAVYDALVGEAARTNGRRLLSRDQRARRTYELLGVDYALVGP